MAHGKIDRDYVEDYLSSKLILPIRMLSFDSSDFLLICVASVKV